MKGGPDPARHCGPRLAAWIVSRVLPARDANRLLDALDDEYVGYQRQRGALHAHWWYWRQALRSTFVLRRSSIFIWRDVRFAWRTLRRAPAYTAAAVLTLALGVGATTAIFSVVHAVVLRDLPYAQSDRIVRGWTHSDERDIQDFAFTVLEYDALQEREGVFEAVGGEFPISLPVIAPGQEPRQVQGRMVTPDIFRVFAVAPRLGRMFTADEIAGGTSLVTVVSHAFWTRSLGADPAALDRSVDVDGQPYTVIGVLPAEYRHVSGDEVELFVPFTIGTSGWIGRWLEIYGRVRPGVTPERADTEFNIALARVAESQSRSAGWRATVEPLHTMVVGDVRPMVLATFAMVGLVLLIACLNVANLTLARGTSRASEFALRTALGASRARLMRQLLIESLLLALVGGVAGVLAAAAALRFIVLTAPASIPRVGEVIIDPVVLVFAAAVVLGTATVCGLVPAWRSTRAASPAAWTSPVRTTSRDARFGGLLGTLVISEVALALALLVGAGLMIRTFQNLAAEDFGFSREPALTLAVTVPAVRWPGPEGTLAFFQEFRAGLLAIPGVTAAGVGSDLPLSGTGAVASATSEARVQAGTTEGITVLQRRAGEGFFEALGTPILSGRGFDEADRPDGPLAAIISESLARLLFADEDPIGQRVAFGGRPNDDDWMTVVGVVADVRYRSADQIEDPQFYQAHTQSAVREMSMVVRTKRDAESLVEPARAVLAGIDPRIPMDRVRTLQAVVDRALGERQFAMGVFTLFGVVALVLTVAGIYGVIAFGVGRRRREIGVRLALGARRATVVGMVVREGMVLVGVGLLIGGVAARLVSRWLGTQLYGVAPSDPSTYLTVAALLAMAGFAASYFPARLGARLDPARVLRQD